MSTKRPGIELVVSAHKSVAVLGVVGRADDLHRILDAETDATIEFLDAWTQRQGGRRGKLAVRTPTSGLTYGRTRHATSRAGDPNPHDHMLVANVIEMLDDRLCSSHNWTELSSVVVPLQADMPASPFVCEAGLFGVYRVDVYSRQSRIGDWPGKYL